MNESQAICTVAIMVATGVCSFIGFQDRAFRDKYLFSVPEILAGKQYYRVVTSAFVHADWSHLLLNMISLYLFGRLIEGVFGVKALLLIYFAAVVGGSALALWIHRHHDYRAYGASGGVCGVIFSSIMLFPGTEIGSMFLPGLYIPGWLYAILFLGGSFVAMKRNRDNIGHDAHLGGALIGFWTAAALEPSSVSMQWKMFLVISAIGVGLFVYLARNSLFLPMSVFVPDRDPRRVAQNRQPPKSDGAELDAILEKISKSGMNSLTREEKALLQAASKKYQRRADSSKPESDLIL